MRFWPFKEKKQARTHKPNPHRNMRAGFFSTDTDRVLSGWETQSYSIDNYLKSELTTLRARSRRTVRSTPYGKRFTDIIKSNVVGPNGVQVSANRTMGNGKPDKRSNEAVEKVIKDWMRKHCDFNGNSSFIELQNMAIISAAQDGEFFFEKVQRGKYSFQLKAIDAELLDIDKHEATVNGEIRLGIEYNKDGERIYYHFREKNHLGDYHSGNTYKIRADRIIHGFIPMYPDQSRGIPWTAAGLEDSQHLKKYQEGALVNARASANTFNVLRDGDGMADQYEGDEYESDDVSLDNIEPGATVDIGSKQMVQIDPNYPHQMYDAFVKTNLRGIASAWGISYTTLANDLEGVNFSSIRSGVLEDRELFKGMQNWFIRVFVEPVMIELINMAYLSSLILLPGGNPVSGPIDSYEKLTFQGRRWAWVDPQKDMNTNKTAIDERLKSRSQIMREQGDDPEAVWAEIAREQEIMNNLGIAPITKEEVPQNAEHS